MLYRGHGMPPAAVTSVQRFHINYVPSATWALIGLVTLTCDLLTLKLVRIIARGVGNLPTHFGTYENFRSRLMANTCKTHHVTLRP